MAKEYRARFSFPASILGPSPDRFSEPTTDQSKLPKWCPGSEENHGWVSGIQSRNVTDWEDDEEFCPNCRAGMDSSEHHEKCES